MSQGVCQLVEYKLFGLPRCSCIWCSLLSVTKMRIRANLAGRLWSVVAAETSPWTHSKVVSPATASALFVILCLERLFLP